MLKQQNGSVGTFVRYIISGGIAAVVHFVVLIMLVELLMANATLASAVGFCFACFVNYNFQYHWTFSAEGPHHIVSARYTMVTLVMLGVNTSLFWFLNEKMGATYILSQVFATGAVVPLNYIVNRSYTFSYSTAKK